MNEQFANAAPPVPPVWVVGVWRTQWLYSTLCTPPQVQEQTLSQQRIAGVAYLLQGLCLGHKHPPLLHLETGAQPCRMVGGLDVLNRVIYAIKLFSTIRETARHSG